MRRLFIPITKIDEEKREVYGTLTQEVRDREDEVFDYATSKPFFEQWSNYFKDVTGGRSLGNLRAMHRPIAAGKLTAMAFDDDRRAIDIAARVVDDDEWQKCVEGVYTGFSAAGHVVKRWRDPDNKTLMRYTADPYEASLADFPCVPTATFKFVKAGGVAEDRTFAKTGAVEYADQDGRRFPLATKSHVRLALGAWGKSAIRDKYDDAAKAVIGRRIRDAARRFDIAVSEKAMMRGDFSKGLYDVGRLASFLQELGWLQQNAASERDYELDNSPVPDKMLSAIAALANVLEEMTGEECNELLAQLGMSEDFATAATTSKGVGTMADKTKTPEQLEADAREFRKRLAKGIIAKIGQMLESAKVAQAILNDHCEKVGAFHKDVSTIDEGDEDVEKFVKAFAVDAAPAKKDPAPVAAAATGSGDDDRFTKLASRLDNLEAELKTTKAERDELEKTVGELAEAGAELTKAIAGRPGILKAVGRENDGDPTPPANAGDAKAETPRDAFKKAFQKPEIVTGVPGATPAAAAK